MKKWTKLLGFGFGILLLTGCTKSFCSVYDQANMIEAYAKKEVTYEKVTMTQEEKIILEIEKSGAIIPSQAYFDYIEKQIAVYATTDTTIKEELLGDKTLSSYTPEQLLANEDFLTSDYYAVIKFSGHERGKEKTAQKLWYNFTAWTTDAENIVMTGKGDTIGLTMDDLPSEGYLQSYKVKLNVAYQSSLACITPNDGKYDGIPMEGKSWGDAFNLGLIEGLLVYPIAWLLYTFSMLFSMMGAWGAILAIFIVTIIVRGVLLLCTFKSTLAQTKMTELNPKLDQIRSKYPHADTNQYEKERLSQETMELYKKNGVSPFSMIFVMVFQFPIFIAVWGAMSGSAILREGLLFNSLQLSAITSTEIFSGNIFAIILFIIMAISQILSMKIPLWLQRKEQKKTTKLGSNPAQEKNQKTMSMVNNVMLIMIILMGLSLPVAMAIYWIISAFISLGQSFVIRKITRMHKENDKFAKYKTKK